MHSNAGVRSDLFPRPLSEVRLTEFFGGVSAVEVEGEAEEERAGDDDAEGSRREEGVEDALVSGDSGDALEVRRPVSRRRRTEPRVEEAKKGGKGWVVAGAALGLLQLGGLVAWSSG